MSDEKFRDIEKRLDKIERWQVAVDKDMKNLSEEGKRREDRLMTALETISQKQDDLKDSVSGIVAAWSGGKTLAGVVKWVGGTVVATSAAWLAVRHFFGK